MVDQDGFTVNYAYDPVGQLTRLTNHNGETIVSYTYDDAGRLVREDNGNGTATTYEYDAGGQVLHVVNLAPDNSVNSRFDYTYDSLGRRTTMTTLEGTWQYGYDANSQLTSVQLPDGRTIHYQYDAAGNRIAVTDDGEATAYTTNNLNQYTAVSGATYTYDTDGNLIAKTEAGQTSTYTYDAENRLVGAITPEGNWTYEYDALGNRTATIKDGQRIEYLVDPFGLGDVVGEYDANGNPVARYIHGIGLESRVDANNAKSFYDFDALGSTAGLSDANGDYLNHYSYLPFGEDLTKVETVPNSFEYVGEWGVMDEGNGLDFMRNRYYSPELGRFTAVDAIGLAGGDTNFYRYVGNNPLNLVDPLGLDPVSEDEAAHTHCDDGTTEVHFDPAYKDDLGTILHEYVHELQCRQGLWSENESPRECNLAEVQALSVQRRWREIDPNVKWSQVEEVDYLLNRAKHGLYPGCDFAQELFPPYLPLPTSPAPLYTKFSDSDFEPIILDSDFEPIIIERCPEDKEDKDKPPVPDDKEPPVPDDEEPPVPDDATSPG
nr:RHS repeat-associated core domain-containing protein [Oxynema sp. CENA135]